MKSGFTKSLSCGGSIAILCTAIAASGILPPALSTVEVASAVSGLLSAAASAYGLCGAFRSSRRSSDDDCGETP